MPNLEKALDLVDLQAFKRLKDGPFHSRRGFLTSAAKAHVPTTAPSANNLILVGIPVHSVGEHVEGAPHVPLPPPPPQDRRRTSSKKVIQSDSGAVECGKDNGSSVDGSAAYDSAVSSGRASAVCSARGTPTAFLCCLVTLFGLVLWQGV